MYFHGDQCPSYCLCVLIASQRSWRCCPDDRIRTIFSRNGRRNINTALSTTQHRTSCELDEIFNWSL